MDDPAPKLAVFPVRECRAIICNFRCMGGHMPKYRFHLYDRDGFVLDDEGSHHRDAAAAVRAANKYALDLLGSDIASGAATFRQGIVVASLEGEVITRVTAIDALQFAQSQDDHERLSLECFREALDQDLVWNEINALAALGYFAPLPGSQACSSP